MSVKSHITELKKHGERITPVRLALIGILSAVKEPQTPQQLLARLARKGFKVNKTTVYRQLELLERHGIVQGVHLSDRVTRYELITESGHHHHLVCLSCQRIEDVMFPTDLEAQEKIIWRKNKFKVLQHSLEFFGLCQSCQRRGRQPKK